MLKRVIILPALLVVIVLIFCSYLYFRSWVSIPKISGEMTLENLANKVTVTTDEFGVPHIEAQSEEDLYYALGFIMARDRLFQMEMIRRIGSGRLSEILGPHFVDTDKFLRTLRLRSSMQEFLNKNAASLDQRMLKLSDRFFEGINEFIRTRPLPPEYSLLGFDPEPFSLVDALAASGYISLTFAEGLIGDLLFSQLEKEFGEDKVKWLRKGVQYTHQNTRPDVNKDSQVQNKFSFNWDKVLGPLQLLEDRFGLFHGSNSFVMSGSRTNSGLPILSNDPHIAFSQPGTWYEAHIKSPDFEIYGHFFPLVPFAILGHSRDRAWAVTMAEVDDLDLFIEKYNEKGEVIIGDKSYPLDVHEEIIKVRFGTDEKIKIKVSPHGPLLDGTIMGDQEKDFSIALAWSFHHPENNVLTAFYKLNRAQNYTEFKNALSYAASPALNISWADNQGNIAWHVMSKIPSRSPQVESDKLIPGHILENQYQGYIPFENNPHALNPKSGIIVTTNFVPPVKVDYPLDGYWQPGERYYRLIELLSRKEKWDIDSLKSVMVDQNTVSHKEILPELLLALKKEGVDKELLEQLKNFDGSSDISNKVVAIYQMWIYWIMKFTFEDELGLQKLEAFSKVADYWHTFRYILVKEDCPWWDNVATKQIENRRDIISNAFDMALNSLTNKLGPDNQRWLWGDLHTVTFKHPLSKIPGLGKLLNVGPSPVGGGSFQVNNMSSPRLDDSFSVTLGPSTRRLIDLADVSVSQGILPTGNVGHFLSPFYSDQSSLFLKNIFRAQFMDQKKFKNSHSHELALEKEKLPLR